MYIKTLRLKNYRNYNEIKVDLEPKINIFYGDNAEGKTNLLESIYMCSTSKSHRNSKDSEIINFKSDEAHIKLVFIKEEDTKEKIIDIQLNKETKKGIAINGIKIEKLSEFLGFFNVVMFAPEDLNIIKEGPQIRRKFLDIEICQIDKIYVNLISNYNRLLNQRNVLLKDINKENGNNKKDLIDILDTYDEQLVNYGIEIIEKRTKNIDKLSKIILEKHLLISDNKEKLIIKYENDVLKEWFEDKNKKTVKETYLNKLKETREIDIKNQYTLIGPHRDDIGFYIDENDIRKYGSQGQKKTAAISLKLSELEMIKEKTQKTPVLLLDDVFSELDETRQKQLVNNLKEIQTIITCTGIKKNIFELLNPNKVFKVKNGIITEVKKE